MTKSEYQPAPTGACWCGCGAALGAGSFFAQGHDKVAEAALLAALGAPVSIRNHRKKAGH
ncbi:hypothetical protein CFP65_5829 [Kitasatospora sp. MMS16-BH015]|uniref:hypothetical protein n=1 Tax=Kitasatospora sp. MMS16-BH015 TaxID=2018025 RepID=UPI000CA2130D|nr:hypothetical protein [Kitasatospora sp. MMS16-BH015]AUG80511.1 hypothetical protein CFP65_5829 [Kitasatospora sp. MMS16-BH015]